MSPIRLFISSVSAEFKSYRKTLRHNLERPSVSVKVQEDFIVTGTETLDMLDDYIKQCDAVIHLVGDMTGDIARPPSVALLRERYPDLGQRLPPIVEFLKSYAPGLPYTQWEAWLALYHRKPLIIAVPAADAKRDDQFQLIDAQRKEQQKHLARLAEYERYPGVQFANDEQLALEVLRSKIHDILAKAGELCRQQGSWQAVQDVAITHSESFVLFEKTNKQLPMVEGYQPLALLRELSVTEISELQNKSNQLGSILPAGRALLGWEENVFKHYPRHYETQSLPKALATTLDKQQGLVILGPPGAGKSLLLQYITQQILSDSTGHWPGQNKLLVNLSLPNWKNHWQSQNIHGKSLSAFLTCYFQNHCHPTNRAPDQAQWESWLESQKVLLLLDGLDEIQSDAIAGFERDLKTLLSQYGQWILTCRTISFGHLKGLLPSDTSVLTLEGFDETSRNRFIRTYQQKFCVNSNNRFDAERLIEQIDQSPDMQTIAATPLLLSMLCVLIDEQGIDLPASRSELYRALVDKRFEERRPSQNGSDYPQTAPDNEGKLDILAHAALQLFAKNSLGQTHLSFSSRHFQKELAAAVDKLPLADKQNKGWVNAFIQDLIHNSGLIRQDGDSKRFSFFHLTIQEYLAAKALAQEINDNGWDSEINIGGKNRTIRNLVDKKAWSPRWHEVLVLLAGQLDNADLVKILLDLLSDENQDDEKRHRLALAGLCAGEIPLKQRVRLSNNIDQIAQILFDLPWAIGRFDEFFTESIRSLNKIDAKLDLHHLLTCNQYFKLYIKIPWKYRMRNGSSHYDFEQDCYQLFGFDLGARPIAEAMNLLATTIRAKINDQYANNDIWHFASQVLGQLGYKWARQLIQDLINKINKQDLKAEWPSGLGSVVCNNCIEFSVLRSLAPAIFHDEIAKEIHKFYSEVNDLRFYSIKAFNAIEIIENWIFNKPDSVPEQLIIDIIDYYINHYKRYFKANGFLPPLFWKTHDKIRFTDKVIDFLKKELDTRMIDLVEFHTSRANSGTCQVKDYEYGIKHKCEPIRDIFYLIPPDKSKHFASCLQLLFELKAEKSLDYSHLYNSDYRAYGIYELQKYIEPYKKQITGECTVQPEPKKALKPTASSSIFSILNEHEKSTSIDMALSLDGDLHFEGETPILFVNMPKKHPNDLSRYDIKQKISKFYDIWCNLEQCSIEDLNCNELELFKESPNRLIILNKTLKNTHSLDKDKKEAIQSIGEHLEDSNQFTKALAILTICNIFPDIESLYDSETLQSQLVDLLVSHLNIENYFISYVVIKALGKIGATHDAEKILVALKEFSDFYIGKDSGYSYYINKILIDSIQNIGLNSSHYQSLNILKELFESSIVKYGRNSALFSNYIKSIVNIGNVYETPLISTIFSNILKNYYIDKIFRIEMLVWFAKLNKKNDKRIIIHMMIDTIDNIDYEDDRFLFTYILSDEVFNNMCKEDKKRLLIHIKQSSDSAALYSFAIKKGYRVVDNQLYSVKELANWIG